MSRPDLDRAQWKRVRTAVLQRDGHTCQNCGQGRDDGVRLEVDHLHRVTDGGDPYDMAGLLTLCSPCHRTKTRRENTTGQTKPRAPRPQRTKPIGRDTPTQELLTGDRPLTARTTPAAPPAAISRGSRRIVGVESPPPRFVSDSHRDAAGSQASGLRSWGTWTARAWQDLVMERALQVREDGSLCWPVVVILTPRQVGKSVLLRSLGGWWGEVGGLTALHVANRLATATEVWQPEARRAKEAGFRVLRSKEQPEVHYPSGGRYLVQAGTVDAGVGFTIDRAMVDEAWRVPMEVVTQALSPAMSAVPQPQLWMVSTAGDAESALLRHYRSAGLDPASDVFLAEWSAPEGSDWLDEDVWAAATPHFDQRRLEFMRQQASLVSEPVFRSQFLNMWVHSAEGWMPPSLWAGLPSVPMPEPLVVAVEQDLDGTAHHLVEAGQDSVGHTVVSYSTVRTFAEVDAYMAERRTARLLAPPTYRDRLRSEFAFVGQREVDASMRAVMGLCQSGLLAHPHDPRLDGSVLSAQARQGRDGSQSLQRTPGVSLAPARAFLWAAWAASATQAARPRVYVRSAST